ncbi:MAG: hypothetical protein LBH74_03695 [Nitrososphaerota archaeon]|jgi:hypothetical protein|nr:hypothetical protein [Nitrososphaerota archaeon]
MTNRQKKDLPRICTHIQQAIEEFRNSGKKTYTDLRKAGIPESTLERVLKHLQACKLIVYQKPYYIWYEQQIETLTAEEYERRLVHSKLLISALESIRSLSFDERNINLKPRWITKDFKNNPTNTGIPPYNDHYAVFDHLKSYPEIWNPLVSICDFLTNPGVFLEEYWRPLEDRQQSLADRESKSDKQLSKDLPNSPSSLKPLSEEEKSELEQIRKTFEEIEKKTLYYKISHKLINEKILSKIVYDVNMLILKINHGEPLEGKCRLCTDNIHIRNNQK